MLRNTFLHLKGIGREREKKLWKNGIKSWELYIENYHILPASFRQKQYRDQIYSSVEAMEKGNHHFFEDKMPHREKWRAYKDCRASACFLDIETTGLHCCCDDITLIGLSDGENYKAYIKGKNLDDFVAAFRKYTTIITFNGWFDKRFIAHHFPDSNIHQKLNIDLRSTVRQLGYSGGFKEIEKKFWITRPQSIQELDGFDAVVLWQKYLAGNEEALDLLIEYNRADITNMKPIIENSHMVLKKRTFGTD